MPPSRSRRPNVLSSSDESYINQADRAFIVNEFVAMKGESTFDWIPYAHIHGDGNLSNFSSVPISEVCRNIAVRGPLHTIDGWSYFSRAISALIAGDGHAVRHLSYYAELRAALSILASNGILILNRINKVVNSNGTLLSLTNFPTHEMCWLVFKYWGQQQQSVQRMLESIKINNVSLFDCIEAYFPGWSRTSIGRNIIPSLGVDLNRGSRDRYERNFSSYQLNELMPLNISIDKDITFINEIWKAFEPEVYLLEAHMLRNVLRIIASGGISTGSAITGYSRLDNSVSNLYKETFFSFPPVSSPITDEHPIIQRAKEITNPVSPYSMLARAALLLKISTSLVQESFRDAGIDTDDFLTNWRQPFGEQRGFWQQGKEPEAMSDLWTELSDTFDTIGIPYTASRYDFLHDGDIDKSYLTEAERIALWSLCS